MNKALYTYAEAAHLLSFRCKRTIERLVESGELNAVYPRPRSPRISAAEIDRYVQSLSGPYTGAVTGSHTSTREKGVCKRKTASTSETTRRSGGAHSSTEKESELGDLLGYGSTH